MISEGHQIHKIEDIGSAFRFLSGKFNTQFREFSESSQQLTQGLSKLKKDLRDQRNANERFKLNLKKAYQELKQSLKNKRNKMARGGERILKENSAKLGAFSTEVDGFQKEMQKWTRMQGFLDNVDQCDEEDMFFFLEQYTSKVDSLTEDQHKLRELSQLNSHFYKPLKLSESKVDLKLTLLNMIKKNVLSDQTALPPSNKSRPEDALSVSSKITSKKLQTFARKAQNKPKKILNLTKAADDMTKPFKYVSKTLMMDSLSIQKNLKNLQKDLSGEQFRQNYVKINPRSGKPSSGFNRVKNTPAKLQTTSNRKPAKNAHKQTKLQANLTRFQFTAKPFDKLSSSKLKNRRPKPPAWKTQNMASSRSQQHLFSNPISQSRIIGDDFSKGGKRISNKLTSKALGSLHSNLRSNSHSKQLMKHNISIDYKTKANSRIEFYKPRIDVSKKHAVDEYEVVDDRSGAPMERLGETGVGFQEEFALSIHGNEEISLKSMQSKHWKKAPF